MTAPDVTALAAALTACHEPYYQTARAEAIIAALAAQGWRVASVPGYATGGNDDAPSTRTQAVPDWKVENVQVPDWKVENVQTWLDAMSTEAERQQAAVRAALEGLRAEVAVLTSYKDPHGGPRLQARVLAIIDARLAALDG